MILGSPYALDFTSASVFSGLRLFLTINLFETRCDANVNDMMAKKQ
jgi:hypothetical protein